MTISPEKTMELRVKYLEMIQTVISRVANNGAALKNYCLTLVTAICGFSISLQRPLVAAMAFLPVIIFALLDAQYLKVERRFRGLFDQIAQEDWSTMPTFQIDLALTKTQQISFLAVLCSWSILIFYAPLAVAIVAIVLISGHINGHFV
jgi:hypothetical protein